MTPEILLSAPRGLVVAPAGCGKTHLLVETVKANAEGRVLVLTHTRAGVAAIRGRLPGVSPQKVRVTTLDAWAAWLASSFPGNSKFAATGTAADYDSAKEAANRVLAKQTFSPLLTATYCRVLVDEYQDCNSLQHEMVQLISVATPTIAFGDPMQAIFDFDRKRPKWDEVVQAFGTNWMLKTPHRWERVGETEFGRWILNRRRDLEAGGVIDFRAAPANVRWIAVTGGTGDIQWAQLAALPRPKVGETLLVLNDRGQAGRGARAALAETSGSLAVVERADLPDLLPHARRIAGAVGAEKLRQTLLFAEQAISGIDVPTLMARIPQVAMHAAGPPSLLEQGMLDVSRGAAIGGCLMALKAGRTVFRPDLYESMCEAARLGGESLHEAARYVLSRRANAGRRVEARAIGSTLLLKGLEADHAVVLDADSMSRRDLYVAMSRGSRTLTVVSRSPILPCIQSVP